MRHGFGYPLSIGHGEQRRLPMDGADLCSPGLGAPERPVDVLWLGGALKAMGDPVADAMLRYAPGVPVGLGVDVASGAPSREKVTEGWLSYEMLATTLGLVSLSPPDAARSYCGGRPKGGWRHPGFRPRASGPPGNGAR